MKSGYISLIRLISRLDLLVQTPDVHSDVEVFTEQKILDILVNSVAG